jgi:hypothetical protein
VTGRRPIPLACGLLLGCSAALALLLGVGRSSHDPTAPTSAAGALVAAYGKLPLSFEANGGRTDRAVEYLARGPGYGLFLTRHASVLSLTGKDRQRAVVRTRFVGANRDPLVAGSRPLPGKVNSLVGDRSKWRTGIDTYRQVRYRSLYPGIDLVYYGNQREVEYDFVLRPGADPQLPRLGIDGARKLSLDGGGDLLIKTSAGMLRHVRPVAYQQVGGKRRPVQASYEVRGNEVGFRVGRYDPTRVLVIDPVLTYSTYLGGDTGSEAAWAIAVDSAGSAYVTGYTTATDFPRVGGTQELVGEDDAFVTKFVPSGASLVYSTFLGGDSSDNGAGIAVDSEGNAYVTGYTASNSGNAFPTTDGAYDTTGAGGGDAFVAELNAAGDDLIFSTFYGGTDEEQATGIALDPSGGVYAVGQTISTDLPTLNPMQGSLGGVTDTYFARFAADGSDITYSTYIGGTLDDSGGTVAVDTKDATGNAVIAGTTTSTDFPASGGNDTSLGGSFDAFFIVIDPQVTSGAASRLYSTYYGGTGADSGNDVAVLSGSGGATPSPSYAYIGGWTTSADLPNKGLTSLSGTKDGFVTRIPVAGGAPDFSSYVGGSSNHDEVHALALDPKGNPIVAGVTASTDFPESGGLAGYDFNPQAGSSDAFVTKLHNAYGSLIYSTYLGDAGNAYPSAIAVDSAGAAYVAGSAGPGFPLQGAFQAASSGGQDGFVSKISMRPATIDSGPSGPTASTTAAFTFHTPEPGYTYRCRLTGSSTFSFCTAPRTYSDLADGTYLFEVEAVDNGSMNAPAATRSFTVDTRPPEPFALLSPGDEGLIYHGNPRFEWQPASDAATDITGYDVLVDGAIKATRKASTCEPERCSWQLDTGSLHDGRHTWSVRAHDAAGNARDSSTFAFTVEEHPVAALTIAPNPALIGRQITFDGSASADGSGPITRYEWDLDGDGQFERDTGVTPTTTGTYPKAGAFPVTLRVTDGAGLTATAAGTVQVNSASGTAVQFGVTVNKAAKYTNDPDVKLSVVFPPLTSSILVSNDGGFGAPKSFLPVQELDWTLDSTGPERLPKTVYVRFLPSLIPGLTFTDDIILDETAPKVSSASVSAAAASAGLAHAAKAKAKKWKLKVKATDSNSGVDKVQVTANKRKPGKLLKYRKKLTVKSAKRPKFVRARDRAGNYSKWRRLK